MLRKLRQFGITGLIVASSIAHPLLTRAIASSHPIAQAPGESAPNRPTPSNSRPSAPGQGTQGLPTNSGTSTLRCVSECNPSYPSVLSGEEGSVRLRLAVDRNGNVVDAQVLGGTAVVKFGVDRNGNAIAPEVREPSIYSKLSQAALDAVKKMKFTPRPSGDRATVQMTIRYQMANSAPNPQRQIEPGREREVRQDEPNLAPSR